MKWILIKIIVFYQKFISPMNSGNCRYYPTCSSYGKEAIEKHGAIYGSILTIWRIMRCNPFSKGGYDPVPFTRKEKKEMKLAQKNDDESA